MRLLVPPHNLRHRGAHHAPRGLHGILVLRRRGRQAQTLREGRCVERLVVEDREALERRAHQGGAEDRVLPESRRAGYGQVRGFPKNARIFRRNESEVAQSITSPGDEGRGECLFDEASSGGDIGMGFSFRLQHMSTTRG